MGGMSLPSHLHAVPDLGPYETVAGELGDEDCGSLIAIMYGETGIAGPLQYASPGVGDPGRNRVILRVGPAGQSIVFNVHASHPLTVVPKDYGVSLAIRRKKNATGHPTEDA